MGRPLSSAMKTAILANSVRYALLGEFDFLGGTIYCWSGTYPLVWNGNTYLGIGFFGTVGSVSEVTDGSAQGTTLELSGVPTSMLALVLAEESYQGRPCRMYLACFDTSWALLGTPYQFFAGLMDVMGVRDGDKTGSISLSVESRMIELNRPRVRRYTSDDQQIDFPNDTGFRFVQSIQLLQIYWGNPSGFSSTVPGSAAQTVNVNGTVSGRSSGG